MRLRQLPCKGRKLEAEKKTLEVAKLVKAIITNNAKMVSVWHAINRPARGAKIATANSVNIYTTLILTYNFTTVNSMTIQNAHRLL